MSLSYLKRFPIHELKIDRSFVDGISNDADDRAISQAIIALAEKLGMTVIAEGVEGGQQDSDLHDMDCGHGQGFFYAHPMPARRFADWFLYRPPE